MSWRVVELGGSSTLLVDGSTGRRLGAPTTLEGLSGPKINHLGGWWVEFMATQVLDALKILRS